MSTVFDCENSTEFLRQNFLKSQNKNTAYSMRSFARKIGISHSHMVQVFQGTKRISPSMASRITTNLKLPPAARNYFLLLVHFENAKSEAHRQEVIRQMALSRRRFVKNIVSTDVFKTIGDWYHFAILVLVKIKNFKSDPEWIAKKISISPDEARTALDRLVALKLLERTARGKFKLGENIDFSTTDDVVSSAVRENHRQQIGLAKKALDTQPVSLREFNNLTLSMDPQSVVKAKVLIREFIDKFNAEMDIVGGRELFQMNVQFFQLSSSDV